MRWYFAEQGQKNGPHEDAAFQELIRSGQVGPKTLVWRTGMDEWQPLEQVQQPAEATPSPAAAPATASAAPEPSAAAPSAAMTGAADAAAPARLARCGVCGAEHGVEDLMRFRDTLVCASCKPAFVQRMREGTSHPGKLRYAGFWIRFAAKFIDWLILTVFSVAISFAMMGMVAGMISGDGEDPSMGKIFALQGVIMLLQMSVQAAFVTFFLSRYAATPGKMATGLVVVRSDRSSLTVGRAFGRYFGEMLSGIILCIGYLMAGFDEEKRALHDRLCDTRVVFKTSVT